MRLASLAPLALLLVACSEAPSPEVPARAAPPVVGRVGSPVPIVWITIDTLRRDHLGCYGYDRDTSPNLDAFAAESVLFEHAVATMATTLPSHLSMLTGLYPHQHGLQTNRSGAQGAFEPAPGRTSAAVLLSEAGYRTAAFTSAVPLCRATGVLAGFETLDDISPGVRPARETAQRAVRWIQGAADAPFFAWVHLWDPHEPNLPARRHTSALGPVRAGVLSERGIDAQRLEQSSSEHVLGRLVFPEHAEGADLPPVDDAALRAMLERYDGDVRATDEAVGRVFAKLRELGLWDRSIVIVVADHGQSLGQHDWLDHGTITNENVLVPLLVRFPPALVEQPLRVSATVSLVDVFPTVFARLGVGGLERLAAQAEGRDVFSGEFGRAHAFVQRTSMHRKGWVEGRQFALVGQRWKYVHHEAAPDQLFDLHADPLETRDVLAEYPDVAAELGARVREVVARRPAPDNLREVEADPELLEALEALGYVDDGG